MAPQESARGVRRLGVVSMTKTIIVLVALMFILSGCSSEDREVVVSPGPPGVEEPEYRTRIRIRNASGYQGRGEFNLASVILRVPYKSRVIDFGAIGADEVSDYVIEWPAYSWPIFDLTFEVDGETARHTYSPDVTPGPRLEDGSYTHEIQGNALEHEDEIYITVRIAIVKDE
jgi:hypothetical protein